MGLVERFSKLRSRWSRSFPPNLARLMLLGCAALWGGSYLLAKFAMEAIPPQWLMGLRMIGACLCMLALFHKHIDRKSTRLNSSHNNQSRMPSSA